MRTGADGAMPFAATRSSVAIAARGAFVAPAVDHHVSGISRRAIVRTSASVGAATGVEANSGTARPEQHAHSSPPVPSLPRDLQPPRVNAGARRLLAEHEPPREH
jgi:hypothetical protein